MNSGEVVTTENKAKAASDSIELLPVPDSSSPHREILQFQKYITQ